MSRPMGKGGKPAGVVCAQCRHGKAQHIYEPDDPHPGCWAYDDAASGALCGCLTFEPVLADLAKPKKPLPDPATNTPGGARHDDLATSKRAAADIAAFSGRQRLLVLSVIVQADPDGLTHHEILARLPDMAQSGPRTRCSELERDGWVVNTGRTRPSPSGEPATVWALSDEGRANLHLLDFTPIGTTGAEYADAHAALFE